MLETVLTSLLDQFQWLRKYKTKVILALCVGLFLLGLPLCCDVSICKLKQERPPVGNRKRRDRPRHNLSKCRPVLALGGIPHPVLAGGITQIVLAGGWEGVPILSQLSVPHPVLTGTPSCPGWGVPRPVLARVPHSALVKGEPCLWDQWDTYGMKMEYPLEGT